MTLHLVAGATFHDGEPVEASDVAFSIMNTKNNHPFQSMFAPVSSIDTPDVGTVVITLSQPHPANSAPVGSRPFMLDEFTPGEAVILKKTPNFFMEGRPKLDEIIIRIIKDRSALLIAMEDGEANLYRFMAGSQEIRRLEKVDHLAITADGYAAVRPDQLAGLQHKIRQAERSARAPGHCLCG